MLNETTSLSQFFFCISKGYFHTWCTLAFDAINVAGFASELILPSTSLGVVTLFASKLLMIMDEAAGALADTEIELVFVIFGALLMFGDGCFCKITFWPVDDWDEPCCNTIIFLSPAVVLCKTCWSNGAVPGCCFFFLV